MGSNPAVFIKPPLMGGFFILLLIPSRSSIFKKRMRRSFPSISLKISLLLVVSMALSLSLGVFFRYNLEVENILTKIDLENKNILSRLSKSLVYPLWSFDEEQVKELIAIEMTSPYVLAIILNDRGKNFTGQIRNRNGIIIPYSSASLGLLIRSTKDYVTTINYSDVVLGEIKVYSSTKALETETMKSLESTLTQGLITTIFGILFLYLGLRFSIVNPLQKLSKTVVLYGNDFLKDFKVLHKGDEVQSLARNFKLLKTSLSDYNQELLNQLHTERITGLQNRRKLFIDLETITPSALLLINIDEFKQLNDFYGNSAGDFILASIGKFIKSQVKNESFLVYKMPADEFAVLAIRPDITKEEMENISKYFISRIQDEIFNFGGTPINLNITIGISIFNKNNAAKEILYTEADMALRFAKKNKKTYFFYDHTLNFTHEMEENIHLSRELKEALKLKRVIPYYQPILHNLRGTIDKYECLVRMFDQKGAMIPPSKFLGVAKRTKLYPMVTQTVLEMAFHEFKSRHHDFSINLSLEDILDSTTRDRIIHVINQNPETASRLVIELLESEGIENYTPVIDFIAEVKNYGCKIAIDDFGSGYSNFGRVLKLDVDILKIDASLIKNIHKDINSQIVTRTITNFSKELGFQTIAEFVSEESVYRKVVEMGIDYSQGYFIGEPKATL